MSQFSTDPKKIKAQILRYERDLRQEYARLRFIDDSAGNRYLLGPLYLFSGDLKGAVKSFAWFEQMFPDDMDEPAHLLCWTLALYRSGDLAGASHKLRQTMLSNLYLLPKLLGQAPPRLKIWQGTNLEAEAYLQNIPPEIWKLWDTEALQWAQAQYERSNFESVHTRYIEIHSQLQSAPVSTKRSQLVAESFALRKITPGPD